jgi:hypothetical protein
VPAEQLAALLGSGLLDYRNALSKAPMPEWSESSVNSRRGLTPAIAQGLCHRARPNLAADPAFRYGKFAAPVAA